VDDASQIKIAELLREGNEPICYVKVGGVFWALLLLGRGEVHGFGFGWGVALADVHEQAELLQVVVQVVGAGNVIMSSRVLKRTAQSSAKSEEKRLKASVPPLLRSHFSPVTSPASRVWNCGLSGLKGCTCLHDE
jgi:hypothetical protein